MKCQINFRSLSIHNSTRNNGESKTLLINAIIKKPDALKIKVIVTILANIARLLLFSLHVIYIAILSTSCSYCIFETMVKRFKSFSLLLLFFCVKGKSRSKDYGFEPVT